MHKIGAHINDDNFPDHFVGKILTQLIHVRPLLQAAHKWEAIKMSSAAAAPEVIDLKS